ncbi:hypothetical protein CDAR_255301 [Caerostris darwini]|uniref:Uncharacterized protein n=1 Tax=Caerostris darwini TaxID=1538125 RepID=A0AAV4V180_9ARAC|nr:hypothetical protein CDAR_255301 [Caerostris darwini]
MVFRQKSEGVRSNNRPVTGDKESRSRSGVIADNTTAQNHRKADQMRRSDAESEALSTASREELVCERYNLLLSCMVGTRTHFFIFYLYASTGAGLLRFFRVGVYRENSFAA